MSIRPPLVAYAAAAALGLSAACGPAGAETLADALALAYAANPTLQAERARLRATEELKAQAWAGALPQIEGEASYSKLNETQTFNPDVLPIGDRVNFELSPFTGGVSAGLPVFDGFRNYNAIMQARARVRAGGAELAGVEQDVLRRTAAAYYDVLRDQAVYESHARNVEVLAQRRSEADLRREVGEITRTDVSQAEARLAGARAELAAAQAKLALSRAAYAELVGRRPGTLAPAAATPDLPETLDAARALAAEYAPGVLAAQEEAEARRRQIAIARGALLPRVSVTANYQYADEPNSFVQQSETFSYGLRATAPIFSGGRNLSQVREARALHDSARARVIEAERRAETAVSAAWEQLHAARMTIAAARAQAEASALALDGVRREAEVGERTTLDVLDAEREHLDARVTLARAERDEQVAAFDLLAAAGVLTLDAIGVDPASVSPASE